MYHSPMGIFRNLKDRIKQVIANYRLQKTLRIFRREMTFWGYPLDEFTNEELLEGAIRFGELASQCGITIEEFYRAFNPLTE